MAKSTCYAKDQPDACPREGEPHDDDQRSSHTVHRLVLHRLSPRLGIGHDGGGDHASSSEKGKRDEDQFVQVAEHRDEVGDQVDRAEDVTDDAAREELCVPRHAGITVSEVEGVDLSLERPSAVPPVLETHSDSIVAEGFDCLGWSTYTGRTCGLICPAAGDSDQTF